MFIKLRCARIYDKKCAQTSRRRISSGVWLTGEITQIKIRKRDCSQSLFLYDGHARILW